MSYHGDFAEDSTAYTFTFTSRNTTGQPHALVSGNIDVYKGTSTTPTTAGVTLTSTYAEIVGWNHVSIDFSTDAFYAASQNYSVILSGGTVNSVAVTGELLSEFSIDNRTNVVSTADLDSALTAYGGTTLGTSEFVDAATTALETHGASTITSTDVDDSLTSYSASTHTTTDVFDEAKNAITTLSVASTGDLDSALTNYGASTLGTTEHKDITTTALEDFGPSTHTTTDVFDQAKNAISTLSVASTSDLATALSNYGVSTVSSASQLDIATTALETHGASTLTSTDINDEVLDVLTVDTFAEPGQGLPGATIALSAKIGFLYKGWRNLSDQSTNLYQLYNDDAATVDQKATISATTSLVTKNEIASGP